MAAARLSGRVRRVPGPGDVLVEGRDGAGSGRGAADVQVGGCGAGGDAARGVRERLPGFDLVVAVAVPVGGDPGGGDHGQGVVVGGGPGGCGQRGGGGPGPDGGDQGAAGGGERQVPGRDRLAGAGAFAERCGDGGGGAGGGVDEFGGGGPGGVLLADQLGVVSSAGSPRCRVRRRGWSTWPPAGRSRSRPSATGRPARAGAQGGWCGRADR